MPYQQFTGLLDKNGKGIYEGDKTIEGGVVVFTGGRFFIDYGNGDWEDLIGVEDEIIGNIHDNQLLSQ